MSNARKSPRQQEKVRALTSDLLQRSIDITNTTKHDVLFDYSGHVNHVGLSIYIDGYDKSVLPSYIRRNPTEIEKKYDLHVISGICLDDDINEIVDFFKVANAELDKLLETSEAA
jgi:hypothetical protein